MAYYFIGVINVNDEQAYEPYMNGAFASLQMDGVEALAYGQADVVEGAAPGERLILLKFRDKAVCDAWYNSPAYQGVIAIRHATADTPFLVGIAGLS